MLKRPISLLLVLSLAAMALSGCGQNAPEAPEPASSWPDAVTVRLSDDGIDISGQTEETANAVYTDHDIVYYEEGRDFTYGQGSERDAHSAQEAAEHTVVHITQPGTYVLQGRLSKGQVAVDLGEEAEDDPEAVVTLVLDGVDITCKVAPAIIFYHVYECGSTDAETATKDVDTSAAGANVIIADGTSNTVNGSYVARIYQPDSVVLSEDGTEVEDAKKLHKYDAAFYSKMSMNVNGGEEGTGTLKITAENEGLDSELHLTINGGIIDILSGNDGINTNEDGVSVTTINGGSLSITVTGETGEGDGIDSNGWLVINGGMVFAAACSSSADAGIDSDMGIHINGGTVVASGHMLDRVEDGGQTYSVFSFSEKQAGGSDYTLKAEDGHMLATYRPANDFSILLISESGLTEGTYTLWQGDTQLAHSGSGSGMMGGRPSGFGGQPPENGTIPEAVEPPDGTGLPQSGERPELPAGMEMPEGMERPERPEGAEQQAPPEINGDGTVTLPDGTAFDPSDMQRPSGGDQNRPGGFGGRQERGEPSLEFEIKDGGNMFSNISAEE